MNKDIENLLDMFRLCIEKAQGIADILKEKYGVVPVCWDNKNPLRITLMIDMDKINNIDETINPNTDSH